MDYEPTRYLTTENIFWMFRKAGLAVVKKNGIELGRSLSGIDEHCELALQLLDVSKEAFVEPRKRPVASVRS